LHILHNGSCTAANHHQRNPTAFVASTHKLTFQ
jgi:hypothetical protein